MAMSLNTGGGSGDPDVMLDINTTPLIDVMLVLLVMLIITIPIQLHSVNLNLPVGNPPPPLVEPEVVRIDIDNTNQVFWNGELVPTRAALEERFKQAATKQPQPELHVRPDRLSKYEATAAVMASAQRNAMTNIGIIGSVQFIDLRASALSRGRNAGQRASGALRSEDMDFARQQRDPKRHLVGLVTVVALHVLVIYGLMTGMARRAVEVIKKPVTATIVEEIKRPPPPPPPPPPKRIEPPKIPPPVQLPYIPPPEVPPPPPPPQAPAIVSAPEPPKAPYVIQPPPPPAPPPPVVAPPAPPPPKPAVQAAGVVCPQQEKPEFPREAYRRNIQQGEVEALLNIDASGKVTSVDITSSTPRGVFDRTVHDTLMSWKCVGQGEPVKARAIITFRMQ
jgi:biopolymer transport protein ExbD